MKSRDDIKQGESTRSLLAQLKISLQLGAAKAVSVIPTQPLQVVMRMQQSALADKEAPRLLSVRQVVGELWHHGKQEKIKIFSSLYRGTVPAMSKEFLKNAVYKAILITGAPGLAASSIPTKVHEALSPNQYHFMKSVMAGTIAGTGDVVFGGAFESWATFRATSQGKNASASFFKEFQEGKTPLEKISRLYRGAGPSIVKGTVAFSTFFYTAVPIKTSVATIFNLQKNEPSPWYATLVAATLSGGAVALTSSPFDIVKTQAQMPNAGNKTLLQSLATNYQTYGRRGLTAGLPVKTFLVVVGWGIAFFTTQGDVKHHHDNRYTNENKVKKHV